jgi:hypothetical protein
MACFIATAAEAVVTSIISKKSEKNESKKCKISFSRKVRWLSNMLWGGTALLVFEHIWHGEIVPFFPFLTAAQTPDGAVEMIKEIASAGFVMGAIVTAVWGGIIAIVHLFEKEERKIVGNGQVR